MGFNSALKGVNEPGKLHQYSGYAKGSMILVSSKDIRHFSFKKYAEWL
jgi:hypothetical protein